MKSYIITQITLLLMTISMVSFANNIDKVYDGSVTLTNGEILEGKIETLGPTLNEIKVKFIDKQGNTTIYKVAEVMEYRFVFPKWDATTESYKEEVVEYVKRKVEVSPIPFGPKEILIQRVVKGTISLYNFYGEADASDETLVHRFYIEKNGVMLILSNQNYKKLLQELMVDYPSFNMEIGENEYGFQYILTILKAYNEYNKSIFLGTW
jgi:hypothetical protein